jgi:predicted CoA-substrate-specific enzyme activase
MSVEKGKKCQGEEKASNEAIVAGVDIGSTMTKVVVWGENVLSTFIGPTGAEYRLLAHQVVQDALRQAHLSFEDLAYVISTGYGRMNVPFADGQITEVTCHGRGVFHLFPQARTIIDIGGQDSKAIKLNPEGKIDNFAMNDKCAAGTGRFLEVIAESLAVDLKELGELSLKAQTPVKISSICTVFAEQEVVGHLAEGKRLEDVLAGLHEAFASRIHSMAEQVKVEPPVVLTGGGAKNVGLRKALERRLGYELLVPPEPLITGALGAALLAKEQWKKAAAKGIPLEKETRRLEAAKFFH